MPCSRDHPHFLLLCPRYAEQRRHLRETIRHSQFSVRGLLGQRRHITKLVKFVKATGCLTIFKSSPPPHESSSPGTQDDDLGATGTRGGGELYTESLPPPSEEGSSSIIAPN
ncbi:hypothetical protein BDZ89DRAFT_1052224 [Hymenopellis radicata]|nr:hypothetical protein BDZ89DRAFT_1052224 [Hymenopellis radicata]